MWEGTIIFRTIDSLRAFLTVSETTSIRKAAEQLCITQPAVSRRIQMLEAELGTTLFKRSAQGIELTDAGKTLYASAKRIEAICNDTRYALDEQSNGVSGHFRVGAGPAWSDFIVPTALANMNVEFPKLNISLIAELNTKTLPLLDQEKLDVVVGTLQPELAPAGSDLAYDFITEVSIKIFARSAHPLAQGFASENELTAFPWIGFSGSTLGRERTIQFFRSLGIHPPEMSVETSSLHSAFIFLAKDDFLMMLPDTLSAALEPLGIYPIPMVKPVWSYAGEWFTGTMR